MKRFLKVVIAIAAVLSGNLIATNAFATETRVRGKIVVTEGHTGANCRRVILKRNDNGQLITFRIAATGTEDGVLAATLTALTTGIDAEIDYDVTQTTGCGPEPKIIYITLFAPGY